MPESHSTERTTQWASTMKGFDGTDHPIRFAHADSWAGTGTTDVRMRAEREEAESETLAPHATTALGAGTRARSR